MKVSMNVDYNPITSKEDNLLGVNTMRTEFIFAQFTFCSIVTIAISKKPSFLVYSLSTLLNLRAAISV